MESAICVRNLNHHFGTGNLRKQILFDISVDVYPGEIVINTGPSGSGKTTLLTLACGLRSVQDGSVRTLDIELNGAKADTLVRVRRNIGFIFQAHNLLGALTARQNVQMGLELDGDVSPKNARERCVEMLAAVGLEKRVDHYPHQLSGGQKQRVAIARALVRQPKIVLADEPTAALDKASGREVVDILQKLAKEQGCAILLVTHDNRILDVADRILTLEDGKISSFTSGMAANTEHLLTAFSTLQRKGQLERHLKELPESKFLSVLEEVTSEFDTFLRSIDVLHADATRALLDQVMIVTTVRIRDMLSAQRATLYLVDRQKGILWSKVADHSGRERLEIRMPIGKGIAGRVAETGEEMNIADPYNHPDFNPEFDQLSARRLEAGMTQKLFLTQSILCMPILNRKSEIIGVAQLLNKNGTEAFTADDMRRFREFAAPLGIIVETCNHLMAS